MSQTRNSIVSKNGCGRTSHQIFLPLSMQFVFTRMRTKSSNSAGVSKYSGMPVRGKRSKTLRPEALQAGVAAEPERRVRREREQVREEVERLVHDLDGERAVLDADVHVQAEDEVRAREHLHLLHDLVVARVGEDFLVRPVREGMRAGGRDAHAVLLREADDLRPHLPDVLAYLRDVPADAAADLDDRLVHLRLDALLQDEPALLQDLLDVRAQLPRLRIDDLELLLDAEREGGFFHAGRRQASLRGRAGVARGAAGLRGRPAGRFVVEPLPPPARNVPQ